MGKNPVVYIDWFNWDDNAGVNTDEKNTLKKQCKAEGAILVTPMSESDNDNLWEYLDLINFQNQGQEQGQVWLGLNDGITEGTYVQDNTKNPVIYIDWFNWDENVANNTDELSSVKFNFDSKTWFRYSAEDFANAVCTKPAL